MKVIKFLDIVFSTESLSNVSVRCHNRIFNACIFLPMILLHVINPPMYFVSHLRVICGDLLWLQFGFVFLSFGSNSNNKSYVTQCSPDLTVVHFVESEFFFSFYLILTTSIMFKHYIFIVWIRNCSKEKSFELLIPFGNKIPLTE